MSTLNILIAVLGVIAAIVLLIKKVDTRAVLFGVGLVMAIAALSPMGALKAFTEAMTKGGLIVAICSSMGFAYVMKQTKCDLHLVQLITKPLSGLGFFLIPIAATITYFINIAIPSAAGCSAAVGATLIPVLMAAGVRPAMAGAAILVGTFGSMLSPGSSHTAMIADMAHETIPNIIIAITPYNLIAGAIGIVSLTAMALLFRDYGDHFRVEYERQNDKGETTSFKVNLLFALAPLIPLVILVIGGTNLAKEVSWLGWTNMKVSEAMLIGALYGFVVTRTSPSTVVKEFFKGMGNAYADVMGIIICASVFVAGLKATGAIDAAIAFMKDSNEYVRWGATVGPFIMGIITGSGDAASIAFNTAVTPHAAELGFETVNLGMAAAIAGAIGRTASPIAGVTIVCAGLACANPFDIVKRTFPGMVLAILYLALFMLH